jgi:hypothetical protein
MQNHVRKRTRARTTMPPTTPPAIAATGVEEDDCEDGEEGVGEDDSIDEDGVPLDEGVAEAVTVIGTDVDETIVAGSTQN